MTDIRDFKNLKKLKIMHNDLQAIHTILTTSLDALAPYKKYYPVMESLSILHNSRTLIEIHIHKYKRLVDEYNEKKG